MGNKQNTPVSHRKHITIPEDSDSESDSEENASPKSSKVSQSMRKLNVKLTQKKREIIRSCWGTSRTWHLGQRIYRRLLERKPAWKQVILKIVKARRLNHADLVEWETEAKRFEQFLGEVIEKLDDHDAIKSLCMRWGAEYAIWHDAGLRPEFWADLGEAMLNESYCMEHHAASSATAALDAWNALVNLIVSHCRNGYYSELKVQRSRSRSGSRTRNSQKENATKSKWTSVNRIHLQDEIPKTLRLLRRTSL